MIAVMRSTPVRRAVTEILQTTPTPLSLREIHQRVRHRLPATAYSTIFRLALRLEQEGRITRVDWRARGSRFEWADDRGHHHHIVCSDCGHTVDLADSDLGFNQDRIESRTGFRVNYHTIEIEGTCASCRPD
jgi:Fur family ferric uptake transcriptional regulator